MEISDIGAALGRIPSGIFILTVQHEGQRTGMLASWVMQSSFEPPTFTVAVRKDRYVAGWLADGANVALNILREDEKSMISHFGRGFEPEAEAFDGVALAPDEGSVPVLADALAFLAGTVSGTLDAPGDHRVFAITVDRGGMLTEGAPMIHVRKNGMTY